MAWTRNRPVGLVYHDPAKSCAGYTLFCSVRGNTATLLDRDGRIVWRWKHPEGIQHAKLTDFRTERELADRTAQRGLLPRSVLDPVEAGRSE